MENLSIQCLYITFTCQQVKMIPKRTNVLLENKYNEQKKLCHDNFQLAEVKMKTQNSIFLYNRIQIEKNVCRLGGQFKASIKLNWQKKKKKKKILKHI